MTSRTAPTRLYVLALALSLGTVLLLLLGGVATRFSSRGMALASGAMYAGLFAVAAWPFSRVRASGA